MCLYQNIKEIDTQSGKGALPLTHLHDGLSLTHWSDTTTEIYCGWSQGIYLLWSTNQFLVAKGHCLCSWWLKNGPVPHTGCTYFPVQELSFLLFRKCLLSNYFVSTHPNQLNYHESHVTEEIHLTLWKNIGKRGSWHKEQPLNEKNEKKKKPHLQTLLFLDWFSRCRDWRIRTCLARVLRAAFGNCCRKSVLLFYCWATSPREAAS